MMSDSEKQITPPGRGTEEDGMQPQGALFPVVGIGASAGGLAAFTQLLGALSGNTGMAFVLVQHLDPAHESQLTEILSRATTMPVQQVEDGMMIQPNSVYVIAPNTSLTIARGALHVAPRSHHQVPALPIDRFFESLAEEQGRLSVGVILSGNGTDGSQGLRAIKGQCGLTFVQSESSAQFDGMPRSAQASGAADFVLPPEEIGQELARISFHPYVTSPSQDQTREVLPEGEFELRKIFSLVHRSTGVDFSQYKQTTTRRRIGRRMIVQRSSTLGEYLAYLERHPAEIQELYKDILISVTHFFRDPDSFQALARHLKSLLRNRELQDSFRVWVPGCATGEEVYSLAISLQELFLQEGVRPALQLFGTDISEWALGKARAGRYPDSIVQEVSPERLQRYFHAVDGHFQISKSIRDCCVFAKHDFSHDPPFSRVDLVSCRNTLIYLDQALQKAVMPIFHYSLNAGGLLFLGSSEGIGTAVDLFQPVDRKHKIYARQSAVARFAVSPSHRSRGVPRPAPVRGVPLSASPHWQEQADQLIQQRYAPHGVIINQDLTILQTRGRTSDYLLSTAPGQSQNLLLLAQESLQAPIREAVLAAMTHNIPVQRPGLRLHDGGKEREIHLEVVPLSPASAPERHYFVMFEPVNPRFSEPEQAGSMPVPEFETLEQENGRLKQQLAEAQEYVRTLTTEYEAALEEQKASNEEISSANEELQSTNEELETAKEELQSTNEELTTVNEELQNRNQEQSLLVNDLNNLFAAVNTPVLMFDRGLLLRRFTPAAERSFGLRPADLGRALADLPTRTGLPPLEQHVQEVIDTLVVTTHEMQDLDGGWWSLAIRPYRTLDHRIEGAVLTFADVDVLKRSVQIAEESRDYVEGIVETVREPLAVLSPDLRIERVNQAFYRTFQLGPPETEGKLIYELDDHQWNLPPLRHLLENILPHRSFFEDFAVEHAFPRIGFRSMSLNARRMVHRDRDLPRILLALEDVTERKRAERNLLRSHADLEQFSHAVAHDLQQPLTTINWYSQLLSQRHQDKFDAEANQILQFVTTGVLRAQSMIEDLLAYSLAGKSGDGSLELVSVEAALQEALWNLQAAVQESGAVITYGDLPTILYTRRLTQVLQNLIGNALKYRGKAAPQIHLSAVQQAQEWTVSVRDNGIGFDPENARKIFGVFQRLVGSEYAGTGIGLAICQRVVERFGGSIWAESEPGVGSTFSFTIPMLESSTETQKQDPA